MPRQNSKISLQFIRVDDPDCMLAREIPGEGMSDEARAFHILQEEINNVFQSQKATTPLYRMDPDVVYIARRDEDRRWYRVNIVEKCKHRSYRCIMRDHGKEDTFYEDFMFEAPERFLEVPFQVKTYALANINPLTLTPDVTYTAMSMQPSNVWDLSTKAFIDKSIQGRADPQAEILYVDDEGVIYIYLYVQKEFKTVCVNDALVEETYAYACSKEDRICSDRKKVDLSVENRPSSQSNHSESSSSEETRAPGPEVKTTAKPTSPAQAPTSPARVLTSPAQSPTPPRAPTSPVQAPTSPARVLTSPAPAPTTPAPAPTSSTRVPTSPAQAPIPSARVSTSLAQAPTSPAQAPALGVGQGLGRGLFRFLKEASKSKVGGLNSSPENCSTQPPTEPQTVQNGGDSDSSETTPIPPQVTDWDRETETKPTAISKPSSGDELARSLVNKPVPIPWSTVKKYEGRTGIIGRLPKCAPKMNSSLPDEKDPSSRILKERPLNSSSEPSATDQVSEVSTDRDTVSDGEVSEPYQSENIRPSRSLLRMRDDSDSRDSSPDDVGLSGYRDQMPYLMRKKLERTGASEQELVTASDYGVIVDGGAPDKTTRRHADILSEPMCKIIDRLDIVPTPVQTFGWPNFMRGRNFMAVSGAYRPGKGGGTTYAYLLPLIQVLQMKSLYSAVPVAVGPLALIMCSSWKRVHKLFLQVENILGNEHFVPTVKLYGGGSEAQQEVRIVNACDLLIATPSSFLRLVEKGIIELKRLCYLIFDDGDNLLDRYSTEIDSLMQLYTDTLEAIGDRAAPQQLVVTSARWTPPMRTFLDRYMQDNDAGVIIASRPEATIYTQVRKVVHVIQVDRRAQSLAELMLSSSPKRTLIFTNSPESAQFVHELLINCSSLFNLLLHEDQPQGMQTESLQLWRVSQNEKSQCIMVVTDEVAPPIDDAELVIHYDPPRHRQDFPARLWCMNKKFQLPLQSQESEGTVTILLVTEEWKDYINLVIKDVKNSGGVVTEELSKLAEKVNASKEQGKYTELCSALKAYGFCGIKDHCKQRHMIQRELDEPGAQPFHQKLPTRGEVKVMVTCVRDATCYWVRLLSHRDGKKEQEFSGQFLRLAMELNTHYSKNENCFPYHDFIEGDMCVYKDEQQNYNRVLIVSVKRHIADRHLEVFNQKIKKIEVRLVDIGSRLFVQHGELLQLHKQFATYPYQAVEVFVCGLKPFDNEPTWTFQATDHMAAAIDFQQLEGRIVLALGNTLWVHPLVKRGFLKGVDSVAHDIVCHRMMLDNKFALPNPEHVRMLYSACAGALDLPDILNLAEVPDMAYDTNGLPTPVQNAVLKVGQSGGTKTVEVTAVVHPGHFYVRLLENMAQFKKLQYEILVHTQIPSDPSGKTKLIQSGSLVLTTFPLDEVAEDQPWYRGKVMGIGEDGKYDVFLLDTGESEFIEMEQVRPMPAIFRRWPYQAIECRLADLVPLSGGEWNEEIGDDFWNMVTDGENNPNPLVIEVISEEDPLKFGTKMYAVRLFDVDQEFEIDISQEIIVQGLALPATSMICTLIPGLDEQKSEIPGYCADILIDQAVGVSKSRSIRQKVIEVMKNGEDLCSSRAIGAICQVLGYMRKEAVAEHLCNALVYVAKTAADTEVVAVMIKEGLVSSLCKMLARENSPLRRITALTIREVSAFEISRKLFVDRGALRLLASLIDHNEDDDSIAKGFAVSALYNLSLSAKESQRIMVIKSECIPALTHYLTNASVTDAIKAVDTLKQFIGNVGLQEESRRWTMTAFCKKLRESLEEDELADHLASAIVTMATGSRINKECLLDCDILDVLKKLVLRGNLSQKTRTDTKNLCDVLTEILRAIETSTTGEKSSAEQRSKSRQGKTQTINQPLLKEELKIIKQSIRPQITWFQDRWNMILLVHVKNVGDPFSIQFSADSVEFRAVVERTEYTFRLKLYELVDPDKCRTAVTLGRVHIGLKKQSRSKWPRVTKERLSLPYLKPDFDHYIDDGDMDSDNEVVGPDDTDPLEAIERCKPRPPGLPPPPTSDHFNTYDEGSFMAYDPLDDFDIGSSSESLKSDPEDLEVDDHEREMKRNFFQI